MMKGGNMKFLHLADIHLDMPFKLVGAMGEKRRMMQLRKFLKLKSLMRKLVITIQ